VLGLIVIVLLSPGTDELMNLVGIFPGRGKPLQGTLPFVLAMAYRTLFGAVGCYVAGRLAPRAPLRHALALGAVGLVLSVVGAAATWGKPEFGPSWYPIALAVLALPSAWAGGALAERRRAAP
jgi:hypothetical protein